MTCIVGYANNGTVYMGCDGVALADSLIYPISRPKLVINGQFIFGVAGKPRAIEVVEHLFGNTTKTEQTSRIGVYLHHI